MIRVSVDESGAPSRGRLVGDAESGLRWRPFLRQHRQLGGGLFSLQMRQHSLDQPDGATLRWCDTRSSMQRFDVSTMILTYPAHRAHVTKKMGVKSLADLVRAAQRLRG